MHKRVHIWQHLFWSERRRGRAHNSGVGGAEPSGGDMGYEAPGIGPDRDPFNMYRNGENKYRNWIEICTEINKNIGEIYSYEYISIYA